MAPVQIFLSAVTAEFGSYRDALRRDLDRPNVTVKVQEDFIATGTETLDKLDDYIQQCAAVIHLVGDMVGALAQTPSLVLIRQRYPDFPKRYPALAPFLNPGAPSLSYTQWEAWLALYHGKVLIIAVPEEAAAQRDAAYRRDEPQRDSQHAHLARLAAVERYPEIRFANADRLALSVLRSTLQDILAPPRAGRPSPTTLDQRNRLSMLNGVRQRWIDGVLNQSLYRVARVELGLESMPDSVQRPLETVVAIPDRSPVAVPPGSDIATLFDDSGQALLILGSPGTGKTTLLLELAERLLDRAERDESHPIPAVFNLSTWAVRRRPLKEWLVDELAERGDVPIALARKWVDTDHILPLLDGLDEVALSHREACLEEINHFRSDHGLLPIAVCSRIADYEALDAKLRLRHAVFVQPLTPHQVDDYLARAGEVLEPLRRAARQDAGLSELLTTPLMLWVAMLAYRDAPPASSTSDTVEARTRRLFTSFVDAMFRRRSTETRYSREQTMSWLSWLAATLAQREQTLFYLENLQLDWLLTRQQRRFAKVGIAIAVAAATAPILWLGMNGVLLGGGYGLLGWGLESVLTFVWLAGLSSGLIATLFELRPAEKLEFRISGIRRRLGRALKAGLSASVLFGLAFAATVAAILSAIDGLSVLWPALLFGLIVAPLFGLLSGVVTSTTTEAVDTRMRPNQGTRNSIRNVLAVLVIGGLILGAAISVVVVGTLGTIDDELLTLLTAGAIGGVVVGLIGGLIGGGLFAIRHAVLRLVLWLSGSTPMNYPAFLDYAAERVFLRKVGGGYIFVHRLLLEYFAKMPAASGAKSARVVRRRLVALGAAYAVAVVAVLMIASEAPAIPLGDSARARLYASAVMNLRQAANTARATAAAAERPDGSSPAAGTGGPAASIKHMIVVMLEDRSFDAVLGALHSIDPRVDGLRGNESNPDINGHAVGVERRADVLGYLHPAPDRSFSAVETQIFDRDRSRGRVANMQGFLRSYLSRPQPEPHARKIMDYFDLERVPVLATLALEYAVCDRWFSSVPGPPAPNHAFADYGTSFGEVGKSFGAYLHSNSVDSIYERLLNIGRSARVYQYDRTHNPGSSSWPNAVLSFMRRLVSF